MTWRRVESLVGGDWCEPRFEVFPRRMRALELSRSFARVRRGSGSMYELRKRTRRQASSSSQLRTVQHKQHSKFERLPMEIDLPSGGPGLGWTSPQVMMEPRPLLKYTASSVGTIASRIVHIVCECVGKSLIWWCCAQSDQTPQPQEPS